ncbi:MAG: xanthine dehydrogenase family protein molybdopterin-binding subunit [Bdellovibrionales bacterium]|jgi:CO/xanthine dehydrogenase Mo-binding subunit|nr:xanthine dehydrogenase family protein molybdopterin-binding subunit [Bdellovibrionales bacterium]MBT3526802.1 xanthine dehydrogenase family protein molybdopterin-binding subunit [Bdellovibrionales bacterium]MBT7766293.1 xanthine dehydrogenase family protein molybdopterin-binding subunit [Bdellovibrionales bacterium]
MSNYKYIGKSAVRVDGKAKITGAAQFVDDLDFGPDLLYAAVVESPHAYAIIQKINTKKAKELPGVVKVVTGKEFPYRFGLYMHDRYIFAQDRVRFVGEQVAAVIANDPATALKAARLVEVKYKKLKPLLNVGDALQQQGVDRVHPDLANYFHVPWFYPKKDSNIAHFRKIRRGDVGEGFGDADLVYEDNYVVPRYAHCAIENHAAVGKLDHDGRLTLWTASQSPHTQRHLFAEALAPLGFTHQNVRVITPFVGGGFGGKAGVTMEIVAAALATTVPGRPVKLLWSREQEFYNTYQRQGVEASIKVGVKNDGTITTLEQTLLWDAGAYVEYGANVVNAAGLSATGPYRIPNVKIDSVCVYTNLPPGGPYRGFGYSEFIFGLESHFNQIAKQLGMDQVEFRRKNAIRAGDQLAYGAPMHANGLLEAIDRVKQEIAWDTPKEIPSDSSKVRGRGFSLFWKAPAMPPNASSTAFLKFNEDASINIMVSGMEIGQGYLTVMAQIAAEVLGVPPEKIRVESPDTDRNPYEWQTVASHITWSCGNAVKRAAEDARDQIVDLIENVLEMPRDDIYLENCQVRSKIEPDFALDFTEFIINGLMLPDGSWRGGPIVGRGMFMPEFTSALSDPETGQGGKPNVHYTVGASAIEIEIDRDTGKITIPKVVLAIDCGQALNPDLVKGQITGGMLQGLATVLYEDMRFDDQGRLLNPNFTDYKIPTSLDTPDQIVPIIVEVPQGDGPFGARGMGEHTMIPAAPLIANALYDALGVRVKSMPITAEKIVAELIN